MPAAIDRELYRSNRRVIKCHPLYACWVSGYYYKLNMHPIYSYVRILRPVYVQPKLLATAMHTTWHALMAYLAWTNDCSGSSLYIRTP